MSFYRDEQFDKLSERWANVIIACERGAAKTKDVSAAFNAMTDYLDARFQAATEAAKATGTAGEQTKQSFENIEELPPLPSGAETWFGPGFTADQMREYGQQCAEAARQARQPTTEVELPEGWKIVPRKLTDEQAREIVYSINRKYKGNPMSDYLARAVWEWGIYASPNPPAEAARQPAPVALSDDQIYKIMMDEGIAYYHEAFAKVKAFPANAAEILDVIKKVIAATNRSQP